MSTTAVLIHVLGIGLQLFIIVIITVLQLRITIKITLEREELQEKAPEPIVTCESPFNEVNIVDSNEAIKPNTCPGTGII